MAEGWTAEERSAFGVQASDGARCIAVRMDMVGHTGDGRRVRASSGGSGVLSKMGSWLALSLKRTEVQRSIWPSYCNTMHDMIIVCGLLVGLEAPSSLKQAERTSGQQRDNQDGVPSKQYRGSLACAQTWPVSCVTVCLHRGCITGLAPNKSTRWDCVGIKTKRYQHTQVTSKAWQCVKSPHHPSALHNEPGEPPLDSCHIRLIRPQLSDKKLVL